jgi:hypothetical protein
MGVETFCLGSIFTPLFNSLRNVIKIDYLEEMTCTSFGANVFFNNRKNRLQCGENSFGHK